MSYNSSAQVTVTNNTGGNAQISMSHRYSDDAVQHSSTWTLSNGLTSGPFSVGFNLGFIRTGLDYWWIGVRVLDGPNAGYYTSEGSADNPTKECLLESADNGKTLPFSVDTGTFLMTLISGTCTTSMSKISAAKAHDAKQALGKEAS